MMRPIDIDQVRRACREAVAQIRATATDPSEDLTPTDRRHLQAVARAILILISEPASLGCDAIPTHTMETAR